MIFATRRDAQRSLLEFTPAMRQRHAIVKFWSSTRGCYLYTRVLKNGR